MSGLYMSDVAANSCVSSVYDRFVRVNRARLPLVADPDASRMGKYECPLCGGDLVPMGWFRNGDLHELLHKCSGCGLTVFR